jgi:hypothetical protein
MAPSVGTAIDPLCFEALQLVVQRETGTPADSGRSPG